MNLLLTASANPDTSRTKQDEIIPFKSLFHLSQIRFGLSVCRIVQSVSWSPAAETGYLLTVPTLTARRSADFQSLVTAEPYHRLCKNLTRLDRSATIATSIASGSRIAAHLAGAFRQKSQTPQPHVVRVIRTVSFGCFIATQNSTDY